MLELQSHKLKVSTVSSAKNVTDAFSRLVSGRTTGSESTSDDKQYVRAVAQFAVPYALKIQEIKAGSAEDGELMAVRQALKSSDWHIMGKAFQQVCTELIYVGFVMLRGMRIIISKKPRQWVVDWLTKAIKAWSKPSLVSEAKFGGQAWMWMWNPSAGPVKGVSWSIGQSLQLRCRVQYFHKVLGSTSQQTFWVLYYQDSTFWRLWIISAGTSTSRTLRSTARQLVK